MFETPLPEPIIVNPLQSTQVLDFLISTTYKINHDTSARNRWQLGLGVRQRQDLTLDLLWVVFVWRLLAECLVERLAKTARVSTRSWTATRY